MSMDLLDSLWSSWAGFSKNWGSAGIY